MPDFDSLSINAGVLTLTITRPEALNALNASVISELLRPSTRAQTQPDVQVIILTGSGESFVAGATSRTTSMPSKASISAARPRPLVQPHRTQQQTRHRGHQRFRIGRWLELALACHVRIASENARMGLPEVSLGVVPGYGGTQRLPQVVGKGKAFEMILTAGMVNAADGLPCGHQPSGAIGIAGRAADNMARKMMKNSPRALQTAIQAVLAGYEEGINGFEAEIPSRRQLRNRGLQRRHPRLHRQTQTPISEMSNEAHVSSETATSPAGLCDALKRRHGCAGQAGNSVLQPARTN